MGLGHHARYTNEGNAGKGGANHPKGYEVPAGRPVCSKEGRGVAFAPGCVPRNQDQQGKIDEDEAKAQVGVHREIMAGCRILMENPGL